MSNHDIYYPKEVTEELVSGARKIIVLDSTINSSHLFGYQPMENWNIPDKLRPDYEESGEIRNRLKDNVFRLIEDLDKEIKFA